MRSLLRHTCSQLYRRLQLLPTPHQVLPVPHYLLRHARSQLYRRLHLLLTLHQPLPVSH
jgi:hypothetical protein